MKRTLQIVSASLLLALLTLLIPLGPLTRPEWWFTPAQQSDRLFREGKYHEAAHTAVDPAWQGAALYRAGDFKEAATAFARDGSAVGAFNRANALVMQGKYDAAIKSYDRALTLQADWRDAQENRAIAVARRDRLQTQGGDETGGEVEADEIVFGKEKNPDGDTVQVDAGDPLSDDQLRAVWLRRVQTKPADFLRAKFAFQLQEQAEEQKK